MTALLGGAIAHLERHRARVNELNVFPVADGDTGDNMLATLRAFRDGGPRGALMGARGNSGVILSQLLAGLADGGEPPPEPAMAAPRLLPTSRYRFCTNVAFRGEDAGRWIAPLRALGDCVMVVGEGGMLRAHVHTDDPDAVVALLGDVLDVECSDMAPATTAFALADDGFAELLASMGVRTVAELAPFHAGSVTILAEPQAALVAALAFDPGRAPEENSAALLEALARVRTASVPAGGRLEAAIEALAPAAELLTVLTGEDAPLGEEEIRALVPPDVELEVTPGAPPPWWWLLAAE